MADKLSKLGLHMIRLTITSILILFALLAKAQMRNDDKTISQMLLATKYVDDRIGRYTYLRFSKNGRFEYRYMYDLMGDFAVGDYNIINDTLYLKYDKASKPLDIANDLSHDERFRADTLLIKGHKLYAVKGGGSMELAKPVTSNHKVPKSWKWRRKYWMFGRYQSTRSSRYYMIDSAYAGWSKLRSKKKA